MATSAAKRPSNCRPASKPSWTCTRSAASSCSRCSSAEAIALVRLASCAGWRLVGGTSLFRLYETGDAAAAQERLAATQIWSRRFPWSAGWLRLGLPGPASHYFAKSEPVFSAESAEPWEKALAHAVAAGVAAARQDSPAHQAHYRKAVERVAALPDPEERSILEATLRVLPVPGTHGARDDSGPGTHG